MVAFEYNRQSKKDGEKARRDGAYKQLEESRYEEQLEVRFFSFFVSCSKPAEIGQGFDTLPCLCCNLQGVQSAHALRAECVGTYMASVTMPESAG